MADEVQPQAAPAKKKKEPTNPDSALTWAEMVAKAVTQSQAIAKILEPLGAVNRDADGLEVKPIKDTAGLNYQTMRAIKAEFKKRQKDNGGSSVLGDDTATKAHLLRTRLESCYKLALELAADARDCETQARILAEMYAKANKPKIAAKADKARAAEARAKKRRQDLEAQLQAG